MPNKLGDRVIISSENHTAELMREICDRHRKACCWIKDNKERDERTLILFNLLYSSSDYLEVAGNNISDHISILALATRNLYEINLQVRDVLSSAAAVDRWKSEAATDKIQLFEGLLKLDIEDKDASYRAEIEDEIARMRDLTIRYGLKNSGPMSAGGVAKKVGMSNEHKSMFKFFSKLVHPSSYLVNDRIGVDNIENRKILQISAQLYSWDTFSRICEDLNMDSDFRKKLEEFPGMG